MIHNNKGMLSISGLIVLSIIACLLYYLHDLYLQEQQTVEALQQSTAARNITLGEASKLTAVYGQDIGLWDEVCRQAADNYDLADAVLVDTQQKQTERFKTVSTAARLVHYRDDTYILIIESSIDDITDQICIYLTKKDDELIVERWER